MTDVFISYSHVDNESASADDAQGWIDRFVLAFSTKLRQLCGPTTEVWRDHKIDGSDLLTPAIEENVRRARLFLSILSQSYLESEWCRTELRLFAEAAQASGGLRVGTKSRILKILKDPVDRSAERRAEIDISDLIGYPFFRKRDDGKHWEYDPVLGQEAREAFHAQILELAIDVKALLDALKGGSNDTCSRSTGVTIYVAEAADDLASDAERLRRELRMLGHTVLPEAPNGHGNDYVERTRVDLARANIVIHPISKGMGPMPESPDRRVVPLQYELARQMVDQENASAMPRPVRVVWMPPDALIADIQDDALRIALDADPVVRRCTLESIKSAVTSLAQHLSEPEHISSGREAGGAERAQIYLICDQDDAGRAQSIADSFVAQGFAVTLPLFDGDEAERREDHDETLRECDAVLVLHASSTDFWRRAKMRDLKRAFGNGRRRPFAARGLLLSGAASTGVADTLDPDLIVMRAPDALEPTILSPFLDALNRRKGATG
ncbi:MAG: toll/interleukin-1 receptor domain-containing protein [Candidatus Lustribacter sp.]